MHNASVAIIANVSLLPINALYKPMVAIAIRPIVSAMNFGYIDKSYFLQTSFLF